MTPKEMEKLIKKDGWKLIRINGSHHQYRHATKPGIVTIPFHDKPKDLQKKTVSSIFKQAGLK
ncbi:type II toxin-antitoxin system HicA family toxin [Mitsuokella sp. AF33-22]|uniref:type II toxin-antitoxin system HicA family toxin n=1 Tax=Mitsuokella sp. AF33-22 TaxID=2292047 RepID=UPI000E511D50|nr:type II toxin-antitoxin system HicA family toxin [Mitsuokella sp. AF33-22]RHM55846.1 type II toxin-antitoxin system HicA family toxin [Mitsuokella sp. AF33-22]